MTHAPNTSPPLGQETLLTCDKNSSHSKKGEINRVLDKELMRFLI